MRHVPAHHRHLPLLWLPGIAANILPQSIEQRSSHDSESVLAAGSGCRQTMRILPCARPAQTRSIAACFAARMLLRQAHMFQQSRQTVRASTITDCLLHRPAAIARIVIAERAIDGSEATALAMDEPMRMACRHRRPRRHGALAGKGKDRMIETCTHLRHPEEGNMETPEIGTKIQAGGLHPLLKTQGICPSAELLQVPVVLSLLQVKAL